MVAAVTPFLMFEGRAEEAMDFWVELIPGASKGEVTRFGPEGPGKEGTVLAGFVTIGGQTLRCFDSPAPHAFSFTAAFSLFVDCEDEAELRRLADALAEGGGVMMPVNNYGFSRLFAWVSDRFGVSWQLNLA